MSEWSPPEDGTLNVLAMTCSSCHGSATSAAPPLGANGETATTTLAVGAHQRHLDGGTLGRAVACSECHAVPTAMDHANGTPEVAWGPLSRTGGAVPAWNRTAATCASTYCHGQFVGGNLTNAPRWTAVDGSQVLCGSCHGNPPAAPHVQNTACGSCHVGYTGISVNLAVHVDGKVDVVTLTCSTCHGSATNAAPPAGTRGETATSTRAVGAHQVHLSGGASRAVAYAECHVVPAAQDHANGTVEVTPPRARWRAPTRGSRRRSRRGVPSRARADRSCRAS